MSEAAPRWDLTTIYPATDAPAFESDVKRLRRSIDEANEAIDDGAGRRSDPRGWLRRVLPLYDGCIDLFEQLESYTYAGYSVDTGDTAAQRALNRVAALQVPLSGMAVRFRNAVAELPEPIDKLVGDAPDLAGYRFSLEEARLFQRRQMPVAEEMLAADLARSGTDAWSRLQETISSQLSAVWDEETEERKSVVALRALAFDVDRAVREKAWRLEIDAWRSVETPLAFALNGVKGTTATLNQRRGWRTTLERSTRQNRLTDTVLNAMITEMRAALPLFRRYLNAKARVLGVSRLAFFDLFAPVGSTSTRWSYDGAIEYIEEKLSEFDPELGAFVRRVHEARWIDALPREGKVGGGYCISFPVVGESRILTNYDGSYDGMSTLAHELGHAWHTNVLADLPASHRQYPMTLAETASIFNETLVFYRALDELSDPAEQIYIVEQFLQTATQVIVDILSRFEFESAVMEARTDREIPAEELCAMMLDAQKKTYGDALDPERLHPYMWAVKGHYYRADLAFYNFPYAFGQLFGLGLYDQYEDEPDGFAERYRAVLRETGREEAVTVAGAVGFDLESPAFWNRAISRIAEVVDRFESLAATFQSAQPEK